MYISTKLKKLEIVLLYCFICLEFQVATGSYQLCFYIKGRIVVLYIIQNFISRADSGILGSSDFEIYHFVWMSYAVSFKTKCVSKNSLKMFHFNYIHLMYQDILLWCKFETNNYTETVWPKNINTKTWHMLMFCCCICWNPKFDWLQLKSRRKCNIKS